MLLLHVSHYKLKGICFYIKFISHFILCHEIDAEKSYKLDSWYAEILLNQGIANAFAAVKTCVNRKSLNIKYLTWCLI